jgi:hypothetical protein
MDGNTEYKRKATRIGDLPGSLGDESGLGPRYPEDDKDSVEEAAAEDLRYLRDGTEAGKEPE